MKVTIKELRETIQSFADSFAGSNPNEAYDKLLQDDPALKKKSTAIPNSSKKIVNSWAKKMGLTESTSLEAPIETLRSIISKESPDSISDRDYIDTESGEVILGVNEKFRTSPLHPQYKIDKKVEREKKLKQYDDDFESDDDYIDTFARLEKEYFDAAEEFIEDHISDEPIPDEFAYDIATAFLSDHENQRRAWKKVLDITDADIISFISSELVERSGN